MACSCRHSREQIEDGRKAILKFGELFVKRMTVDSEHQDRRRKDFNQAIFFYDEGKKDFRPCFDEISLEMIIQCFNDALEDWRKTFCDSPNCNRKD